ncbi:FAD/NAD(P)-binding domain-containing protein [Stipitochalara longipes BDJ]|nr:FAD/NAD(P)-binding domain-containing protein [Stipitochalara longipes BDJ]
MSKQESHVIIIGAGITGLLTAQGLKLAGIPFSIFDSESSQNVRTREWTLAINYASHDLETLLPSCLYSRLREAYTDPHHDYTGMNYTPMYNGGTGEKIYDMVHRELILVSRRRMRKLCSEGLEVRYGMRFQGASFENEKVQAKFEGGEVVEGDLLVGCDGTKSGVRKVLLGAEKAQRTLCRLRLTTANVKYANPEAVRRIRSLTTRNALGYHSDGMFNMIAISNVPDPNDPTTWEFYLAHSILGDSPQGLDNATILASLKSHGQKLADPFKISIMEISESTPVFNDRLYYWIPIPWDNHDGRMTLAGDAAHPMPPYRGQGLGQSIRDATLLVGALKAKKESFKSSIPSLINDYEEEMIKRSKEEVEMSVQALNLAHDWEKLLKSPIMKLAGRKISEAQIE